MSQHSGSDRARQVTRLAPAGPAHAFASQIRDPLGWMASSMEGRTMTAFDLASILYWLLSWAIVLVTIVAWLILLFSGAAETVVTEAACLDFLI